MSEGLGSLAQSARSKQLKSAKVTIIAIGLLTVGANLVLALMNDYRIDEEVKKLQAQGLVVDQKVVEATKRETQLTCAGFGAIGIVFIVMGFFVSAYPVPITILALVLYLAGFAISAVLDPATIPQGIIIKIIIIGGLVRSIKAALEYERERSQAVEEAFAPSGSP